MLACFDRASGDPKFYFFDRSWQLLRVNKRGLEAPDDFTVPKPDCIQEMFTLAERLSEGFPFLRVDLYESFGHIYFGELTLYPSGGVDPNYTPEADRRFGDLIPLNH